MADGWQWNNIKFALKQAAGVSALGAIAWVLWRFGIGWHVLAVAAVVGLWYMAMDVAALRRVLSGLRCPMCEHEMTPTDPWREYRA